jgi:hypothetical protein
MLARDSDSERDAIFQPDEAGLRLLELWTRADTLAALVAVACTTATGIDQKPIPRDVVTILTETLVLAEETRARAASSRKMASNLAKTLARIAARLDQWLDVSGATIVDGRPVEELRRKLAGIIAP